MPTFKRTVSILLCIIMLTGCSVGQAAPPAGQATSVPADTALSGASEVVCATSHTETTEASATPTAEPTQAPTATPVPAPILWIDPALEPAITEPLLKAADILGIKQTAARYQAGVVVAPSTGITLATWVYALVAPFPTIPDEITYTQLRDYWSGSAKALSALTGDDMPPTLFVTKQTLAALKTLIGEPSDKTAIQVADAEKLVDLAWAARPHALAVVPFDALEPRWKVLRIDGLSLLDKEMDPAAWPLTLSIGIDGLQADKLLEAVLAAKAPQTNRDTSEMTVLMMSGVTALVRSIAYKMENMGILYPGELISATLASADLTHISNEIPFTDQCPYPNPVQEDLVFCSSPKYIDLLRSVGTDIVELTGNHFQDYGDAATLQTVEMYKQEGWPYYGGGANLAEASRAITLTSNGNTFSFIGCNPVGPSYAWATKDHPGAAPCNYDFMHAELKKMAATVDVPVATFQYDEIYMYEATAQQEIDFRGMADAGAKIVSGSQAHHPQAIEFYKGAFIHYGLGNLFFDQMQTLGTRQEFVDRHVIYKGRHISTELLTFMLEDYSQPRPMTPAERAELLNSVFEASGW
ncbi:MAG: CapA family protein [Anaerolineae bacterium]